MHNLSIYHTVKYIHIKLEIIQKFIDACIAIFNLKQVKIS